MTPCRVCQSTKFTDILDLGMTPHADDFLTEARLEEPETYYPLKLILCDQCSLAQLSYVVPRETLYSANYPYVSSTTDTGVAHYVEMAQQIVTEFGQPGDLAIDIGSNVGVLLQGFRECQLKVLGIEPVPNIAQQANLRGIETINEFFSAQLAVEVTRHRGFAKIVTGTNVVAHIDDLYDLARGIDALLDYKGVFVFEAPYFGDLVEKLEYDTIYHEHLSYLSLRPVMQLFEQFALEVFDVRRQSIHGGTIRYFIAKQGTYPVKKRVYEMLNSEEALYAPERLAAFAERVAQHRFDLNWLLRDLVRQGQTIVAVSAPAKGMTLLNYCGIGRELLHCITEKAPLKIGRYTPGTHLHVVSDEQLLKLQPDYALLLAWNFAEEIMRNLSAYAQAGGQFIIPVPHPIVVPSEEAMACR